MKLVVALVVIAVLWVRDPAAAVDLSVRATEPDGHPLANAVVTLLSRGDAPPPAMAPDRAIIDQRNETFIPLVIVLRRGGTVVFRDSDTTHHHVYSFSPIKRFELMLEPGQESQPVEFDVAGVAAIGCNIHDQMVAYVYVADTPWAALTDSEGRAVIPGVPPGGYVMTGWHPRQRPGASESFQDVVIDAQSHDLTVSISVLPDRPAQARHEHAY